MGLTEVLGVCAVLLSVIGAVPQAVRLVRGGTAAGVPLTGAVGGVLVSWSWFTYGIVRDDLAQIATNVFCGTTALVVLAMVVRHTKPALHVVATGTALWTAAVGAAAVLSGAGAVGALCSGLTLFQKLPQVREVFVAPSLAGLSPWACALGLAASSSWTCYGLAVGDVAVLVTSGIVTVLNAVVLGRRCPASRVVRHLLAGRYGAVGVAVARPVAALAA